MSLSALVLLVYLSLLGALAVFALRRLRLSWIAWRHWRDEPEEHEVKTLPCVTVQLPIFNERNVVERLIDAAAALDWPRDRLQIQVLDDSTDDTVEVSRAAAARARARGIDVEVLHRADRHGYKAGALEAGLAHARGELIAIFDADFVPPPDFLRRIVPSFDLDAERPRVGMVQARWGHMNEGANLLTRLGGALLDGHFVVEHSARHRAGLFFNFNGTAGVWRRQAILDGGGWQHDTVTEDLDLSYRAQLAGWRFVYRPDVVVPSELPASVRAYKNQQHRWAKGAVQTARKLLPRLMAADLPREVRAEALSHLTLNASYPLVLAVAVLLPLTAPARLEVPWAGFWVLDGALFALTLICNLGFYGLAAHGAHPGQPWRALALPGVLALGVGMAVNQTRAVLEGLGQDATFVRTPKDGEGGQRVRLYAPTGRGTAALELGLAGWMLLGLGWALAHETYGSTPWMALFGLGFAYVGLSSWRAPAARRGAGAKPVEIVLEVAA